VQTLPLFGTLAASLLLLITLAGCSNTPSGAYPEQVGPFKLVQGPELIPKGRDDPSPLDHYVAQYSSSDGRRITLYVTAYPSAEEVKRWLQGRETQKYPEYYKIRREKSGGRLIEHVTDSSTSATNVYWTSNNWACSINTSSSDDAMQFVNAVPYK
jgi:hypothetical protein